MLSFHLGVQWEIGRIVVISAWTDDFDALEAAFREIRDLLWFGLIHVDHRKRNDETRIALGGFFYQVVAFARAAKKTHFVDVESLTVIREHVEHAFGSINGQL